MSAILRDVRIHRPRRLRGDITAVVFSCRESDLSRFSVESGPCVSTKPGCHPLVSPLLQDGGETPALTAAFYTALTGRPARHALVLVARAGQGRLSRCSDAFVLAMATACETGLRLADEDEARGDQDLTTFAQHQRAVSDAWMSAGRWPRSVVGLENRVLRWGRAREAIATGQAVYVWHGPPVAQFVIRAGTGPYTPA